MYSMFRMITLCHAFLVLKKTYSVEWNVQNYVTNYEQFDINDFYNKEGSTSVETTLLHTETVKE